MSDTRSIAELAKRDDVYLLTPPRWLYRLTLGLLLGGALWAIVWGLQGQAITFAHGVALFFGGVVVALLARPRHWQPWYLAELGWDRQHVYLLKGDRDQALPLPRSALTALHQTPQIGEQGEWLGFALDLALSDSELAQALALLGREPEHAYEVAPGVYRFAFRRAWHGRGRLRQLLTVLCSEGD